MSDDATKQRLAQQIKDKVAALNVLCEYAAAEGLLVNILVRNSTKPNSHAIELSASVNTRLVG